MSLQVELIRDGAVLWARAYQKSPAITVMLSALVLSGVAGGISYLDYVERTERERQRRESLSYERQLQALNGMERSARELTEFVRVQKQELRQSEDLLGRLRDERKSLEPLVKADRQIVAALFAAQEEKNRASIWRERLIGFGIGILSSLVAAFIIYALKLVPQMRRTEPAG